MGLKPVSVGQLNNYIGRVLRTDPVLGNVSVIGEISNLKYHSSGHVYFSLKDDESKINCFLSSQNLQYISCSLDEGMEIVATGFISVYERGGYYSLNIRDIEFNGSGQLSRRFEELKKKLEREGLFADESKKHIPFFPGKIAVVTSETGAAVRDIIRTIKNKNNYVDILVYPVLVQGPNAPEEIAHAIDDININHKEVDTIIAGRGGGSIEELWAFNEEIVARSIFRSSIPVISAVGHETDFTIADFVSDYRAATPTAAAEKAAPDTEELSETIDALKMSLVQCLSGKVLLNRNRLEAFNPAAFEQNLKSRIAYEQANADRIAESIEENIKKLLNSSREKIDVLKEFIETSNPRAILSRGYSVVTDADGHIICTTDSLHEGQVVNIETGSGSADAEIKNINQGGRND